ncbi:hypothetical protein [Sneathiella litorea]|uniref:Uncharacterized protein n=1 Tax=Sneathiella litorea TaxID=2606216 RepID=A0A6L8W3C4_9PROT|nr:hypothetical protein [Sneathiella litorea]MZR29199.1 hypothetical protein [Sneathiella litorea]
MRKFGILLLGTILLGSFSVAQADSWHSKKYYGKPKGTTGDVTAVYGKSYGHTPNIGRDITYGRQTSKKKYDYKAPAKSKRQAPKVIYVKPKYKQNHKTYNQKSHRPKYVYVKPAYVPRYYGYHSYRGYYWPFINTRFVVNLTTRQIEHHHQSIYFALDRPVGQVTSWHDSGRSGRIVILRDGYDTYGNLCKEYRQTINYRGRVTSSVEVSCLSREGYWISS